MTLEETLNLEWGSDIKIFLKEWFSELIEGIEQINDETWPKILELAGCNCIQAKSKDLFLQMWAETKNVDKFLRKIKDSLDGQSIQKLDEYTLSVTYSKCYCPFVNYGLIESPIICNCTPGWLIDSFETILGKPVDVITHKTILNGDGSCKFTVTF